MLSSVSPISRPFISLRARDRFSVLSLAVVCAVGVASGTTQNFLVTLPLFAAALVVPAPLAFVAGHLAVIPTIGLEDSVAFAVVQIGLLILLTEPARQGQVSSAMATSGVAYLALAGGVAVGIQRDLWVVGVLLCIIVASGTYLMRRITLVRLGLVEPITTQGQTAKKAGSSTINEELEAKE